jgi:hypothetical protein
MGNQQLMQMKSLFASIKERISNPNVDLATARDIVESLHLATAEAEGVTYAELNAGGVGALWCIPKGCDPDAVLLHNHFGGTVVGSNAHRPKGYCTHRQVGGVTVMSNEFDVIVVGGGPVGLWIACELALADDDHRKIAASIHWPRADLLSDCAIHDRHGANAGHVDKREAAVPGRAGIFRGAPSGECR